MADFAAITADMSHNWTHLATRPTTNQHKVFSPVRSACHNTLTDISTVAPAEAATSPPNKGEFPVKIS